ncbi:SAM-dependent methyltransferase [Niallia taxi]|uniref:SAM-dependent methyltransferase n=1 Tax=Niallia taxi TaxID=2499688 RepID=UPI0021A58FAC|nr:SAM-dependent methyltransferase [Niallia taxi]MCT2343682.1 SAM-dependent methyltransferase [Niallia taxi]MDE5055613.1 SAM-dependent methyltransferase [Niallia taxi]MED3965311.1 SAM-dependent methyltransferase [Niallia taxi]WOD62858.1 SAM-dependent methyltransferase [Niallia taxi]
MKGKDYDKILRIKTEGEQAGFNSSLHYHRYEPTPYEYLKVFFEEYQLQPEDRLVDFGCGKGRMQFLLHHLFQLKSVGIEMNEVFYADAERNKQSYFRSNKKQEDIQFLLCKAEEYAIDPADTIFYFFNPFSIKIFTKVINNILFSTEQYERSIKIILYYPSDEYIFLLDEHPSFVRETVFSIPIFPKESREKFAVYRLY